MENRACTCNFCKKNIPVCVTGYHMEQMMGYGSKYDMMKLDMTLCPDCMDWLIDMCGIKPVSEVEEQ